MTEAAQNAETLAAQLKTLKRSKAGHRAYATKVVKETETLLQAHPQALGEVKARHALDMRTNEQLLKEKLVELKELDKEILESILDDAEYEAELIAAGENNRVITKIMIAIKEE